MGAVNNASNGIKMDVVKVCLHLHRKIKTIMKVIRLRCGECVWLCGCKYACAYACAYRKDNILAFIYGKIALY